MYSFRGKQSGKPVYYPAAFVIQRMRRSEQVLLPSALPLPSSGFTDPGLTLNTAYLEYPLDIPSMPFNSTPKGVNLMKDEPNFALFSKDNEAYAEGHFIRRFTTRSESTHPAYPQNILGIQHFKPNIWVIIFFFNFSPLEADFYMSYKTSLCSFAIW